MEFSVRREKQRDTWVKGREESRESLIYLIRSDSAFYYQDLLMLLGLGNMLRLHQYTTRLFEPPGVARGW